MSGNVCRFHRDGDRDAERDCCEFSVASPGGHRGRVCLATAFALLVFATTLRADEPAVDPVRAGDAAILAAMRDAGGGYSVDEILIDDRRRERFLDAIDRGPDASNDDWQRETLLRLVSLRKAGKLAAGATERGPAADPRLTHIAEIAARTVLDRYPVSSDTLMCDPVLRRELQSAAERTAGAAERSNAGDTAAADTKAAPDSIDAYSIRKLVLRLRKTRRLRPELVTRVAEWDRVIETFSTDDLTEALVAGRVSDGPGVYLFFDTTGYLYVGEAANLRTRLRQHVSGSDRLALKDYLRSQADGAITVELHSFGENSPANRLAIRRAYESELIRTRQPRFNVRP